MVVSIGPKGFSREGLRGDIFTRLVRDEERTEHVLERVLGVVQEGTKPAVFGNKTIKENKT